MTRRVPGSHRHGKLSSDEIVCWGESTTEFTCYCAAGSVVVMKPLLLHASSRALLPTHRRVIHIEYANCALPAGLRWVETEGKSLLDHLT